MDRIQHPSATSGNLFTEGNPGGGVPGTTVTAAWLNGVQEELIHLLAEAGITPSAGNLTQIKAALDILYPVAPLVAGLAAEAAARIAADNAEAAARESADTTEATVRAAADSALDARLDDLEADLAGATWDQPGGVVLGMRPMVGDEVGPYSEVSAGRAVLQRLYQGRGYRVTGVVVLPATGSFTAGAEIHVKLPGATGLPAVGALPLYHGAWSSFTLPGGGLTHEAGPLQVVSASSSEIVVAFSSLLWGDTFDGREVRFSFDVVGP